MRITIIGSKSFDSLEYNLNETFNQQGHSCSIVDIYSSSVSGNKRFRTFDTLARRYSETYDRSVFNRVLDNVLRRDPDLVIGVYRFIHPELVRKIKAKEIHIIHINPYALTTFERQQLFVESYDLYFIKDPYMMRFMRDNMNLNVRLYNEAFNTRIHKRPKQNKSICEQEENIDVLAFGNMYPYRTRMLTILKKREVRLALYGKKGAYFSSELDDCFQGKYIVGEEKARILYGAKIVFNNLHYAEIESVNNKFFEINGSGAFQLCDYRPILKDLLPVDPELVSFRTIDDAVEKINYYLDHPQDRYDLSNLIYNHFVEHYSYDSLVQYVLNEAAKI
ncbi:CgeB family protein [Parabacteroides distasonis]|uniref:CgeB family protein n=1 Tax=Parabacteroides distasonis TaxID=823 RepID=UPI003F21B5F2